MVAPAGWIFQAVPKTYDLAHALRDKASDLWIAKQRWRDMAPGQAVYFWLGAPVGGIVAVGQITGSIVEEPAPPEQSDYWRENAGRRKIDPLRRISVRYDRKFPLTPIRRADLNAFPELAKQSPIGGFFAATNFALSDAAAYRLATLVARHRS